jgi:signal recognition particle subunit SRP72
VAVALKAYTPRPSCQLMAPRSAIHAARPVKAQVTQNSLKSTKVKLLPRKDIPLGDRVQRLFTSLEAQIDGNHFTNAIKTCDKGMCLPPYLLDIGPFLLLVLRLVPDDEDARQTKLFLLLQTERYDDALALLAHSNESSAFERAYSLYRLQRLDEATLLIDGVKQKQDNNRGALHLEAQLVHNLSVVDTQI